MSIPKCDAGLQGGITSGWTNILGNKTDVEDEDRIVTIKGRRYCSLKNIDTDETEMIFEEEIKHQCCKESKKCDNKLKLCIEENINKVF